MNHDQSRPLPGISHTQRALRAVPAWCISLAVHALLCVCLVVGMQRPGIPDGSQTDQQPLQLNARFTSIAATTDTSPQSTVEFVAADETPPRQPAPLDTAVPKQSRPTNDDPPGDIVAAVAQPPEAAADAGPAIPRSPPPTSHLIPGNPPSARRSQRTASHFAALLAASRSVPDGPASSETEIDHSEGDDPSERIGQPSGASFFQISAQGQHFCYVVDCSSSMEDENAIAIARTELSASLRRLDTSKRFQILFYDSELHPMVDRGGREVFFATQTNRTLARQFMNSQQPNNRALHKPALLTALRSKPDVIFLLTDGQLPELSARDLHDLKLSNKRRIQINVIEFGQGARLERNWLEQLAHEHRGMYRYEDITERSN